MNVNHARSMRFAGRRRPLEYISWDERTPLQWRVMLFRTAGVPPAHDRGLAVCVSRDETTCGSGVGEGWQHSAGIAGERATTHGVRPTLHASRTLYAGTQVLFCRR
jgi:hypothetical protein